MEFDNNDMEQHAEPISTVVDKTRDRILRSVTYTFSIIVLPALFVSVKEALESSSIIEATTYIGAYVVWLVGGVFLSRRLTYKIRAAIILILLLVVGDFILAQRGLSGAGTMFLAAFCVMATVLLGLKYGVLAITVSICSILLIGWAMVEKLLPFDPAMVWNSTSIIAWALAGGVFLVLSTSMVWTSGILQDRLQNALSLLRNSQEKIASQNVRLKREIEEKIKFEQQKNQIEKQLLQSQKMEALGLMAGGIAHDLNNILSGIVSYPELLLMDLPEDSPLRKPIKTIQESGMRAADVVEDLLTIARGVATGKEALNLNTLVTEYLSSAEYEKLEKMHSFVSCRTELDPDLLNISGSAIHIKKILMNLVANASEAIEGSGTVTISTASRYLDEPLKGYEDVRIGEYAVLSVSDDGSGISPEDIERVFEPFYTKKIMGRSGTGLGLAVVWNTVQDHNGYINVKSSEKGTVFELYFPVTREQVADEKEQVPLDDYLGHGEKILVVDDEERQREIASGILARLGYNAETVSSGEEAIEYVKENPVDLIVLDMVMPKGINGRKTYEEITKIRPGQKAIIASGYAKTREVDIAQRLGAGKYIKKPYTLEKVGVAVKEELEK